MLNPNVLGRFLQLTRKLMSSSMIITVSSSPSTFCFDLVNHICLGGLNRIFEPDSRFYTIHRYTELSLEIPPRLLSLLFQIRYYSPRNNDRVLTSFASSTTSTMPLQCNLSALCPQRRSTNPASVLLYEMRQGKKRSSTRSHDGSWRVVSVLKTKA